MLTEKKLLKMSLHEILEVKGSRYQVTRVVGGWIYNHSNVGTLVFVPEREPIHTKQKEPLDIPTMDTIMTMEPKPKEEVQ